jgi:L-ribulose-5-phosphate 3-epimerase UlaE
MLHQKDFGHQQGQFVFDQEENLRQNLGICKHVISLAVYHSFQHQDNDTLKRTFHFHIRHTLKTHILVRTEVIIKLAYLSC